MVKPLTYWQIKTELKAKEINSVYIFAGEELFLKRQIEELVKARLFADSSADFNQDIFYAEQTRLDKVLDTLRTQPFLSDKRLVILKNADKFSQHEKSIIGFLKEKNCKNVLILETEKTLSDKFIKKLVEYSTVVLFTPLQGADLNKWVSDYAKSKGKKIDYNAIGLLVEKVGNDLESLISSLNKLCLYAGEQSVLKEQDIEVLIKKTREDTRFTFLNALMSKQTSRALEMAHELSRNGKHVSDLIGLINWQFKRLDKVKQLQQKGYSQEAIISQLKITPYIYNIVRKQAAAYTDQELAKGFDLLLDADIAIKQGLKSPGLTLETLIVCLCANSVSNFIY
ncbi:MAG: DNA polymerase III subunit delta [Candidatus Omnitrophica bacterium]|nr:DNA polymerase III subunit delta [Candidatus Omnitrophota bacterium]